MDILGMGFAVPATSITNSVISELNPGLDPEKILDSTGIEVRYSSLPIDYLKETKNSNYLEGAKVALDNPISLAKRAAESALEQAGVTLDKIGLVIGDCATPEQIVPTLGQRLADALQIKVTAFDILSSSDAFSLQLNMLGAWKEEKLPEYALLVSSNVATQRINYGLGEEGIYFGDGSVAAVISCCHPGKLRVISTSYQCRSDNINSITMSKFGMLKISDGDFLNTMYGNVREGINYAISERKLDSKLIKFIGPQFSRRKNVELVNEFGLSPNGLFSQEIPFGNTLGSSVAISLAEKWGALRTGDLLLLAGTGIGNGFGHVLLEVR